ncbi:hypothetical protein CICLE_v10029749mg [Citrus x clementina]|uniref:Uncharacterized protein n=1 Tax=Citrus clementina TaxID=85681 RepID=V4S9V9_CITCL|nr:hypothetical protein CICLE_v10029749mg [Citrus x clementina]ESR37233.1 hypothetical protein CICLE_v10029749mg [Citrus x clementina]
MATEKRASGTTRHGGPKLQLKAVMCNPLCQRRIHSRAEVALPTNTPSMPCIFYLHGRDGIFSDWLWVQV